MSNQQQHDDDSHDLEEINDYIYSNHDDLYFEVHSNGIAEFRINRSKNLNTISAPYLTETLRILHLIEPIEEITLIVFWSGDAKVWSAGGDVVTLTKLRHQGMAKNPNIPLDFITSPSPSPSALYTPPDVNNSTNTQTESQFDFIPEKSSILFSGHKTPQSSPSTLPLSAHEENKLKVIPGLPASTLECNPELKPLIEFFHLEYSLLSYLSTYSKPTISLLSGISYGGGAGIAMATTLRLAALRSTQFGMPETQIGLFPDVGASYFYNNTSFGYPLGRFLGCTGYKLAAPELVRLGLIDGVFEDGQYNSVFNALRIVPRDTLEKIFKSVQLPQILVQYTNTMNILHTDSVNLLKQQHRYQLQQLLLLISTYISPPRGSRKLPTRLGIYLSSQHSTYLAVGANGQGLYGQMNAYINEFLSKKSFLFGNLATILDLFNEDTYDACVTRINNIVALDTMLYNYKRMNKGIGNDEKSDEKNNNFEKIDEKNTKNNAKNNEKSAPSQNKHLTTPINLNTISETIPVQTRTSECAKELQQMLQLMCPASCILFYQMSSHLFSRIVHSHKLALQQYQTLEDQKEQQQQHQQQQHQQQQNNSNNNHNKNTKTTTTTTTTKTTVHYPIYNKYIYESNDALLYTNTPMILNRFITPIHYQHYKEYFKNNLTTITTPTLINYPNLTYSDYLSTEFIAVAHMALGDYSNFNFFSGVNALLLSKKHKSPRWHLFNDVLKQYQYIIHDMYPMDIKRASVNSVLSSSSSFVVPAFTNNNNNNNDNDNNNTTSTNSSNNNNNNNNNNKEITLLNEESWLLLNTMPLAHHFPLLSRQFRHFYNNNNDNNNDNNTTTTTTANIEARL